MAYSISTSNGDSHVFECDANGMLTETFGITVDGVGFSTKYEVYCPFEWISVIRTENGLKLKINSTREPSYELGEEKIEHREGYVSFVHLLDEKQNVQVFVKQKLNVYTVESEDGDEITFSSFPNEKETKVVKFKVEGGSGQMILTGIRQYDKNGKMKAYDHGISVFQKGNEITVVSHGRTFMDDGDKYGIWVCHANKRNVMKMISVMYS